MSDTYLYVVDIRFRQKKLNLKKYLQEENIEVLSLTPYSSFLLDNINQKYITFQSIISEEKFINEVLKKYDDIEKIFLKYKDYSFLFRDIAFMVTYEKYFHILFDFLNQTNKSYKIIYISDSQKFTNKMTIGIHESFLYSYENFYKIIHIRNQDKIFYKKQQIIGNFKRIIHIKNIFSKVFLKVIKKKSIEANYDNKHYMNCYIDSDLKLNSTNIKTFDIKEISRLVLKSVTHKKTMNLVSDYYKNIFFELEGIIKKVNVNVSYHPFNFLSKKINYYEVLLYKLNNMPKVFMQHGSYLHENIFLKYSEIYPADISFVFNDYTKELFEKRGAEKVYSVGSIDFNYALENVKNFKYDYIYITYCTSYSYAGKYIGSEDARVSSDAYNIFTHHKAIIELFGTKFKDKKICIKIQPGIFWGTILYVPFLELSRAYKNITIEFSTPLPELFQCSKYIISDYFSSEFINRKIHYKKDILLFKNFPISLPKETIEDMKKMFILVDTLDDLKEKIENIEKITKNRKRYDDIIEYYSSKKCDTKKVVTKILERELNARR